MPNYPWIARYDPGVPATLRPYPERSLLDSLAGTARERPDHPALLFKGAKITSAQLDHLGTSLAAALAELGVRPSDRVALCLPNCPQFLIAELGAWKAGAIVCPFNPTYSDREMEAALTTSGAETLVVLNRFYEKLKALQPRT